MKDNDFDDSLDFGDWGNDPFEGDMSFDMDFDHPGGKKGFLASFGSGLLEGLTERTVGSTDAKIRTMQKLLPNTWGPTFRNLRDFETRSNEIMRELKESGYESVQDLQYLAQRAAKALTGKVPNKIPEALKDFSERDFSDWQETTSFGDNDERMKDTSDEEVDALLSNENANSVLNRETMKAIGKEQISMMSEIGGRSIASMHSIVKTSMRTNQLLEHMLDYQRRVQQRNDTLALNIAARHHLTSAAYYKFQEAAQHRVITELRTINKYSQMSDYEKTSHSQAMRKSIRESVFNTVKGKFGGFAEFLEERGGKDARSETMSNIQDITGSLRMVAEMTEGMPINVGSLMGNAAAGIFLNQLPRALESGKGQALIAAFKKRFPDLAKWSEDVYKRFEDLGNVASYVTSNPTQIVNTLAKHYTGGSGFDDFDTYDDYLSTLAPGVKPMPRAQWWVLKTARKTGNKVAGAVLDNMWGSTGSTYQMQQRTLEDGHEQALWSRRSDRTLNEEIPRWFALLHQSFEKFRTGNDDIKPLSYDYTKAQFINSKQRLVKVTNNILGRNEFASQASQANAFAKTIDEQGVLNQEQLQALAFQLIKDSDRELGFNPYNYMDLKADGHSEKSANAIRRMMMQNFNITEDDLLKFSEADEMTRTKMLTYMKGEKARAKLAEYAEASNSLKIFGTDLSEKIDLYKSNGYYDAMRQAGIIRKSKYGNTDEINEDLIDKILKDYIKNPDKKQTLATAADSPDYPTRSIGGGMNIPMFTGPAVASTGNLANSTSEDNPVPVKIVGIDAAFKQLDGIKDIADSLKAAGSSLQGLETLKTLDLTPVNNSLDLLVKDTSLLVRLADARNKTLAGIQDGLPRRKKMSKEEENDMKSGKDRIIDKIKQFSFKEFFNKSVDTVLRNEPLILGGLLGGLAGVALHDPKTAMLIAGGGVAAATYLKIRSMAKTAIAEDNEDLYEKDSTSPILEVWKRKRGDYYDAVSDKLIESWGDIKNSVVDKSTGAIIGAKRLAGKLFTAENKEVILSGLNKVRELLGKAWNALDPMNRLKGMAKRVTDRFYQMNVYKEGATEPTLYGKSFAGGAYYKRGKDGKPVELNGWNEIDGPVYDREGNILITQEEYDRGLTTSMGVSITKLNSATKKAAGWLWDAAGVVRKKAVEYGSKAYDKGAAMVKSDYTPITNSIDRIYHLLLQHWGYQLAPEVSEFDAVTATPEHSKGIDPDSPAKASEGTVEARKDREREQSGVNNGPSTDSFSQKILEHVAGKDSRLNSIKDQKEKKKEKKADERDSAIIKIGNVLTGKVDPKEKPEKKGIFGMIFSAIAGIGTFFTKTLWSGIKPMIWFAELGIKALPAIATGVTALTKGLLTLFKTKSLSAAGGSILDTIMNRDGEHPEVKKKRKADREEHRKKPGTKLKKFGLAAGAAYLTGSALEGLQDIGAVEDGDLTSSVMGAVDTAATVYGGYQLASAAAGLAGVELGAVAATAGGALLTGAAWLGGAALTLLSSPVVLGALAVGAVGYGLYKLFKAGEGTQIKLRLSQYGISDVESDLAEKVLNAEKALTKFVVIGNGRASLSKDAPLADVLRLFVDDPKDKGKLQNVFTWFNGRFKPVFLTYMACLDTVKMSSLEEYDKATSQDVYRVASQTHTTLSGVAPYPYSVVAKVDPRVPIMGQKDTVIRVNNYLTELKKYVDRKTPADEKKGVDLPSGQVALAQKKEALEKQLEEGPASVAGPVRSQVKKELDYVNDQLRDLNSNFKVGPQVSAIYIRDLLPDEGTMSLLTAIRVACYGNEDDVHWRVEAVLKLERFCESLFVFDGKEVVFKGQIGDLFGLFKDSFRLKDNEGDEWCRWFRDRFAPVMSNYVLLVNNYRKGQPGVVWKSLSATARYEIAKGLVETKAKINSTITTSIWNVRASPFKGTSSGPKPDKVDRMVNMLGEASKVARLRDPEKEAGKTNTKAWAEAISPHKTGGGYTPHYANVQTADQYKTRRDMLAGGQYGTNVNRGAGTGNLYSLNGVYGTPSNQFGYQALTGDSDTSHLDMSGIQRNEGKDTGVKVPKKLAEQLIIREMLKQGFTDPRAIAEMLALTNYETGGYSRTVENLKYTDPTRLMKLFREVTSLEQARALVAGGEVAIGNAVYGGGKGASLGNKAPGDGYLYRGRGFVQLTGRANYDKVGRQIGVDLVNNPQLLGEDPNVMAAVAVNFYKNSKQLQAITSNGDFGYAAKGLNGGNELPGMQDRHRLYLSYLDQLTKGSLKADEAGAADASKDVVGSGGAASSGGYTSGEYGSSSSTPSMPPLSPAPGGGSQYGTPANTSGGGGWYGSTATSGGQGYGTGSDTGAGAGLVLNRTNDNSGLRLKSAETTAGGDVHPGVKRMCQLIQTNIRTFKEFTALNDGYHRQKKPNSKHTKGLACDFTLTNGAGSSDYAVAIVKGLAQQAGLTPKDFLVLNEYKRMSAGATGGHIHFGFNNEEAANKFNQAAGGNAVNGQDTTTGGGPVQEQPQRLTPEPPAPPQIPVDAVAPRGTGEAAPEEGKRYTPVPLPGRKGKTTDNPQMDTSPDTFKKVGKDNPNLTPKPQPKDTRSNPDVPPQPLIDMEAFADKIVSAIRETGKANVEVGAAQVQQLEKLANNSQPAPKTVPVR